MSSILTSCSHFFTIPDNVSGSTAPHPVLAVVSYSFFTGLVPHLAMARTHSKNSIDLFNQSPTFQFITDVLLRGDDIDLDFIKKIIIGDDPAHARIRFVKRLVLKHVTLHPAIGDFIANSLPFLKWYQICDFGENAEMSWNQELYREDLQESLVRSSNVPIHAAIYVAAFKHPLEEVKANTAWKLGNMLQCYWDLFSRPSIQSAALPIIPYLFDVLDSPASVIKSERTFENCLWCLRWIITKNIRFHSFLQAQEENNPEILAMYESDAADPTEENSEDGGKTTSSKNKNNNSECYDEELLEGKRFATLRHFIFARSFELKQQVLWVISDLLAERPQMMDAAITHELFEPILNLLKFDSVVGPSATAAVASSSIHSTNFKTDENTSNSDDNDEKILKDRKHQQQEIWFAAARVLGDFSQEPQMSDKLIEWHLLECFTPRLDPSQTENTAKIRKELCWCLSNLVCDEPIRTLISEKHPLIVRYMCENMKESKAPVIAKEAAFFVANYLNFNTLANAGLSDEQQKAVRLFLENGAVEGILTFHKTYWTATKRQSLTGGVIESFHPLQRLIEWDCSACTQFSQRVCFAILVRSDILRKEIHALENQILKNYESNAGKNNNNNNNNNNNDCGNDVLACVDGLIASCSENSEKIRAQIEILQREKNELENAKPDDETLEISTVEKSILLLRNENRLKQVKTAILILEKLLLIFRHQVPSELSISREFVTSNNNNNNKNGNDESSQKGFYFQETKRAVEEELSQNYSTMHSRIFTVGDSADAQNACFRDLQTEIKKLYLKKIELQTLLRNNNCNNNRSATEEQVDKNTDALEDEKKLLQVTDDEFGRFTEFENSVWYFPSKAGDEAFNPSFRDKNVQYGNVTVRDHSYIFESLPVRRQLLDFFEHEEAETVEQEQASNKKKNLEPPLPSSDDGGQETEEVDGAAGEKVEFCEEFMGVSHLSKAIITFFARTSQELSLMGTGVHVPVLIENCKYLCGLDARDLFRLGNVVFTEKVKFFSR